MRSLAFAVIMLAVGCAAPRDIERRKLAPEALREDVRYIKRTLEADHPSLYWYTTKDSLDRAFALLESGLKDSLTEQAFRKKLAAVIASIHCGHTSVRSSAAYVRAVRQRRPGPIFPLSLRMRNDSLFLAGNAHRKDSVIRRGAVITSVNGIPAHAIRDSLFSVISTDGYADVYKARVTGFNFPLYYQFFFGPAAVYRIGYVNPGDSERFITTTPFEATKENAPVDAFVERFRKGRRQLRKEARDRRFSMRIDTSSGTATMRLSEFSTPMLRFFKRSFAELREKQVRRLVVDLRDNSGGSIPVSVRLARYLSDHPFRVADTVEAKSQLAKGDGVHGAFFLRIFMRLMSKKEDDGLYHFRKYERHVFQPYVRNHFNGEVVIAQSGFTFSAATMLISYLQPQPNVMLAGEETGGGHYGNTSVFLPTAVLPNSRVRVVMPLYRIVLVNHGPHDGRGIMPSSLSR